MPRFDLPLEDLREYRPQIHRPSDFDAFWDSSIHEARTQGHGAMFTPVRSPLTSARVLDVRFPGYGGEEIAGWLLLPAAEGPHPAVVQYLGYGAGRSLPHEYLPWVSAGYACFVMDTRGQGAGWSVGGVTPDPHGAGPAASGMLTRGIEDPATYYYRRVFVDAVRAVDAVRLHPEIAPDRVAVAGGSQGGGIALAASALSDGLAAAFIDVPFLCHFERAVGLTDSGPYTEIVRYLSVRRDMAERAFATLAYFDGVNFAPRATAPALFSVALMDQICPPSTVFAAHNAYGGPKDITVYPFNGHEGGAAGQWLQQTALLERELTS
jgi:cephalosporin-C deacetylase